MRRTFGVLRFLILMSIAAIMLNGCSIDNKNAVTDSDKEFSTGDNTITLNFSYWGNSNEKIAIEAACKKFSEENPGIIVNPIQIPNSDYNIRMLTLAASNGAPDTGYMTGDLGEVWANEGKFLNLFELMDKDKEIKKEDFLDYVWYKTGPENAWGISSAGECFGLFYNKDLFDKAGLRPPPSNAEDAMDWESFVDTAKKLTIDKNGRNASEEGFDYKNIIQYGVMFETWYAPINNFIFSNGGEWISQDGKEFRLNSPETADALQKLSDLINVHHVAPTVIQSRAMPSMSTALQTKLVAMAVGGQWINLDLANAKVNYDIGVLPKMKKSVTVCTSGATAIYKSSQHPEEAWKLFKWMSNPENNLELYSSGLWMPTMKKWYTDNDLVKKWVDSNPAAHPPGFRGAMMKQLLSNAVPDPAYYLKNSAKIIPSVVSGLDPLWVGQKTAAEALKEIELKVKHEVKGRYDVAN